MTSLKQLSNEWYLATSLYDAIEDENIRAITSLVQEKNANANVIIPDYGYTPLHLAVGHENENFGKEVTKLLMKSGGDANVTGIDGVTPLHVAVAWNRSAVVRLLLSYGANPWIKDDNEKDAFDYANEQQAWDTLKALEALKRSKFEDRNYKIRLDKVIIHSNDVQAEYRPIEEVTLAEKQSVSTQTPRPFVRSPSAETDEFTSDGFETNSSGASRGFDSRYDWCDKSEGVLITEECKRTIFRHRARSSMFEYSPRRSAINEAGDSKTKFNEAKKRFFPPVCCVANDLSLTDDSLSKDVHEIDERDAQNTAFLDTSVMTDKKSSYDYERAFSEDSLMTDDQSSDSKSTTRELNLSIIAKDLPYIDETATVTDASLDRRTAAKKPMKVDASTSVRTNPESMQVVASAAAPKETVKQVSWPGCLSTCACIPSHEEDDSFTMYSSSQENVKKSNVLSGFDALPDETECTVRRRSVKNDHLAREAINANISLEYKITDDEDNIEFIATRMPFTHSSNKPSIRSSPEESDLSSPSAYDTDYIRVELKKLGFISGPMSGKTTKKLYLRKLKKLKKTVSSPMKRFLKQPAFSNELEHALSADSKWTEILSKWSHLEQIMRDHFQNSSYSSSWRAGTAKTSFTYLLLDPRISDNLPDRCEDMDPIEVWQTFVRSIFYIGKGTRARTYEHLREALTTWHERRENIQKQCNLKVSYILEIWEEGLGVVCVQAFHNLISAEAFTREAAMIDAIGLARLKNEKGGVYYGTVSTWNAKLKRRLGAFLLYRAMRIFIADNETQLKPTDVN